MTTKRALSSPIVTVCVSRLFTLSAQATNLTVGYPTGIAPSKVPRQTVRTKKTIGEKIDWRRFNSGPEVVTARTQQTTALLEGGTAKAIGETAKLLKEQGKVQTVLPDYSAYVSAKFVAD